MYCRPLLGSLREYQKLTLIMRLQGPTTAPTRRVLGDPYERGPGWDWTSVGRDDERSFQESVSRVQS
jgi:hypothetical protein